MQRAPAAGMKDLPFCQHAVVWLGIKRLSLFPGLPLNPLALNFYPTLTILHNFYSFLTAGKGCSQTAPALELPRKIFLYEF
jgi:hypothetical protein